MNYTKLVLSSLFFCCFILNVPVAFAGDFAGDVAATVAENSAEAATHSAVGIPGNSVASSVTDSLKTWEQWWSKRAISINPYVIYKHIIAHPVLAMVGTGVSVGVGVILYVRYHQKCDLKAKKYQEIFDSIQLDLTNRPALYHVNLRNIAQNDLKDTRLARLIEEFYQTINPPVAPPGGGIARGVGVANPTVLVQKANEIRLYLFGGNGNYPL